MIKTSNKNKLRYPPLKIITQLNQSQIIQKHRIQEELILKILEESKEQPFQSHQSIKSVNHLLKISQ